MRLWLCRVRPGHAAWIRHGVRREVHLLVGRGRSGLVALATAAAHRDGAQEQSSGRHSSSAGHESGNVLPPTSGSLLPPRFGHPPIDRQHCSLVGTKLPWPSGTPRSLVLQSRWSSTSPVQGAFIGDSCSVLLWPTKAGSRKTPLASYANNTPAPTGRLHRLRIALVIAVAEFGRALLSDGGTFDQARTSCCHALGNLLANMGCF